MLNLWRSSTPNPATIGALWVLSGAALAAAATATAQWVVAEHADEFFDAGFVEGIYQKTGIRLPRSRATRRNLDQPL